MWVSHNIIWHSNYLLWLLIKLVFSSNFFRLVLDNLCGKEKVEYFDVTSKIWLIYVQRHCRLHYCFTAFWLPCLKWINFLETYVWNTTHQKNHLYENKANKLGLSWAKLSHSYVKLIRSFDRLSHLKGLDWTMHSMAC